MQHNTFEEYYNAINKFSSKKPLLDIENFKLKEFVINNNVNNELFNFDNEYITLINEIKNIFDKKIKTNKNCITNFGHFFNSYDYTKDECEVINNIAKKLYPIVNTNIYNCNSETNHFLSYRNLINTKDKIKVLSSKTAWQWHFDNHTKYNVKILLYLTDVNETECSIYLFS